MTTRIEIHLEGDAPGLPEHALSLAGFVEPLNLLLRAIRRVGSGLLTDALGPRYGIKGGRHAALAAKLDFQIDRLSGNSPLHFGGEIVQPGAELPPLFPDLNLFTDEVGETLLRAIEREGQGKPVNEVVRLYLAALPEGVRHQRYELRKSTGQTTEVSLGTMEIAKEPEPLPYIQEVVGDIVGVGFEPGRPEVRLKADTATLACAATNEQVEHALNLRGEPVRALVVQSDKTKLLRLGRPDDPPFVPTEQDEEEHLFKRWHELLSRLAK